MARARGFTLMEVMVALAILAIALAAIVKATAENITNTAYLRDKTLAHWIAMNKLTELQVMDVWQNGESDGKTDFADRTWGWHTKIQKGSEDGEIHKVEVDVFREGDKDHPLATLTGFLVDPALKGPAAVPPAVSTENATGSSSTNSTTGNTNQQQNSGTSSSGGSNGN